MSTTITDQIAAVEAVEPKSEALRAAVRTLEGVRDHTQALSNVGSAPTEPEQQRRMLDVVNAQSRLVTCSAGMDPRTEAEKAADEAAAEQARAAQQVTVEKGRE